MMGASAFCASSVSLAGSLVYCSMYMRMVAPDEPVPDRRKMMRDPSAEPGKKRRCEAGYVKSQILEETRP